MMSQPQGLTREISPLSRKGSKSGSESERVNFEGILSATRLHVPQNAQFIPEATEKHLREYATAIRTLGTSAAIAVNAHEDAVRRVLQEVAPDIEIKVLAVPCWGAFVPALNALLGYARQLGCRHILYHSLEVQCTPDVLQRLLDYYTRYTLVVGAALAGHNFEAGEQRLNGRTAPWNTLSLWSVRKLSVTGFLCIADGLPAGPADDKVHQIDTFDESDNPQMAPMGSASWWTGEDEGTDGFERQLSASNAEAIPAGVEEVTAIALLQHLMGHDDARAILVELPPELEAQVTWKTSWNGDKQREQWHEYKMNSKISRPAAQLELLFKGKGGPSQSEVGEDNLPVHERHFGVVTHMAQSVRPPAHVERICYACIAFFCANFTAILASAFATMNKALLTQSAGSVVVFVGLLVGGIYMPMPASLWLTRKVARRFDHIGGIILFVCCFLISHTVIVASQLMGFQSYQHIVLLAMRFLQGLGSGIGFQARFVLASLGTSDHHNNLQARSGFVADVGLGLGALLPAVTATLVGSVEFWADAPDLLVSGVLALLSLGLLVWVICSFPRRLHVLPDAVRFPQGETTSKQLSTRQGEADRLRRLAVISGTAHVFVQSAILPVVALSLYDANLNGHFRQSLGVAAFCLLPMPFQAMASRLCCSVRLHTRSVKDWTRIVSGAIGVLLLVVLVWPRGGEVGDTVNFLERISQLALLMLVLAMAVPFNTARLYQLKDAEHATLQLAWSQAYVGRLLGPAIAIATYEFLGYGPIFMLLCAATVVAVNTA